MNTEQALVPFSVIPPSSDVAGVVVSTPVLPRTSPTNGTEARSELELQPLNDELVAGILKGRGLRGWLRVACVGRVLGLLTL